MATPLRGVIDFSKRQFRVITASQAQGLGLSKWAIHRLAKTQHWQRLLPGVYLTHSAKPDWNSRAQAALLWGGPNAFLSHRSAWYLDEFQPRPPKIITLNVPPARQLSAQPGIQIIRRPAPPLGFGRLTRTRPEETLLDLIEIEKEPIEIVGLLTQGFRNYVHPEFVLKGLNARRRFRHRKLLTLIISAIVEGIESPLEYLFDTNVEIPHGLPRSQKQVVEELAGRSVRADRLVPEFLLRYELDGEFAHPGGRTDLDTWRDNAALIKNHQTTLRYRWANIVGTPCKTASQIVAALRLKGWTGRPRRCGPNCEVSNYRP